VSGSQALDDRHMLRINDGLRARSSRGRAEQNPHRILICWVEGGFEASATNSEFVQGRLGCNRFQRALKLYPTTPTHAQWLTRGAKTPRKMVQGEVGICIKPNPHGFCQFSVTIENRGRSVFFRSIWVRIVPHFGTSRSTPHKTPVKTVVYTVDFNISTVLVIIVGHTLTIE